MAGQNRDSSLSLRMTSCPAVILNTVKDLNKMSHYHPR